MPNDPQIESVKLKGHQKAVLCLDYSSSSNSSSSSTDTITDAAFGSVSGGVVGSGCLLSGSEDGTARLWDLRTNHLRASLCIQAPLSQEVLSVSFAPRRRGKDSSPSGPTTTLALSSFARDFSVYLAAGNAMYGYDLRKADKPILLEPTIDFSFMGSEDEINQIAFAPEIMTNQRPSGGGRKGKRSSPSMASKFLLASADDAGTVRVTESSFNNASACTTTVATTATQKYRVYTHGFMVTSLAFRPRAPRGAVQLASGGSDCQILLWDVSKDQANKPLSSITIPNSETGANQVCNPPMIISLEWSPSGRLLAASLGDGSIAVLQAENKSLVTVARLADAHGGAVASSIFPKWSSSSAAVAAHDRLVCSSGNDGAVVLWDLGTSLCGDKAQDPSELFFGTRTDETSAVASANKKKKKKKSLRDSMDALDLAAGQPKALFAWEHGSKPNWMVSSSSLDPIFPTSLFLADTTNDITVYTIRSA